MIASLDPVWTLALPLLIPFATGMLVMLSPLLKLPFSWISVTGALLHLAASLNLLFAVLNDGILAGAMGGWAVPVGIPLVADTFAALMVAVTAFMGVMIAVFALADIPARLDRVTFHALFHVLLAGATGAYLAGDLFNLYVWVEVLLIASFGLLVLGGTRAQLDAGIKYVALNLVATISFLAAIGMLHALTGTLTMADMGPRLAGANNPAVTGAAALMLFAALAAKAGLFPLYFWLPAAYHTPATAVTAIFAAILTKVGIYAVIRVFTLVIPDGPVETILLPLAIATMVLGVVGAAAQTSVHRILSFHIVSQIGYVALGLAIATPLALIGAIVYLVHNIVVKANLILIAGVARRLTGSQDLGRAGGLYAATPVLSTLFIIAAIAMAGLPPSSGFWGKLAFVQAGIAEEMWVVVAATLGVGLFTLYSMTKIWNYGYLKPHSSGVDRGLNALPTSARTLLIAPIVALTFVSLLIGLNPEPLLSLAARAAEELLNPAAYIAAVMGVTP